MHPVPKPARALRATPLLSLLLPVLLAGCTSLPGSSRPGQGAPATPVAATAGQSPESSIPSEPVREAAPPAEPAAVVAAAPVEPEGPPRKEFVFAVTSGNRLLHFNAGQPARLLSAIPLSGLRTGEEILGIDFRKGTARLYALGRTGSEARLLTIDTASGKVAAVGTRPLFTPLIGSEFGFDFDPASDRIRVVSDKGQNLRLNPDTGAVIDTQPASPGLELDSELAYEKKDAQAARRPWIAATAHAPMRKNDRVATTYAIDAMTGTLVLQGSRAGEKPLVPADTGRLRTIGALGLDSAERVGFDIAEQTGAAFVAVTRPGGSRSTFHLLDLSTGKAAFIGTIGGGEAVRGIATVP